MAEQLVLIDYGSGNLPSAAKALLRAADLAGRAVDLHISSDARTLRAADRVVLPGVGAFNQCAAALRALPDLWDALHDTVIRRAQPFLGICVGMQLMAARGLEHGVHAGLDWIGGDVVPLAPADTALKVPHMGWNTVTATPAARTPHVAEGDQMYFVHSYHVTGSPHVLATTDHGGPIAALVGRDNLLGTQFHPEKSQRPGLAFLQQFLSWRP